jgi:protocatechuate 3,4-dioxygenase beta subunit
MNGWGRAPTDSNGSSRFRMIVPVFGVRPWVRNPSHGAAITLGSHRSINPLDCSQSDRREQCSMDQTATGMRHEERMTCVSACA